MSPLLLSAWISQAFMLNFDAEAENKALSKYRGWVVDR